MSRPSVAASPSADRRRADGALLPPAAEIPGAWWLDPGDGTWCRVEETSMPRYKDGTDAEIGDLVKGKPFNTPREVVGEVVVITSWGEGSNCVVAFAEVVHDVPEFLAKKYCEVSLKMCAPRTVIPCAEMWHGKAIVPCADYGSTKDFELVHRPPKTAVQGSQPEAKPAAKVMSAR